MTREQLTKELTKQDCVILPNDSSNKWEIEPPVMLQDARGNAKLFAVIIEKNVMWTVLIEECEVGQGTHFELRNLNPII